MPGPDLSPWLQAQLGRRLRLLRGGLLLAAEVQALDVPVVFLKQLPLVGSVSLSLHSGQRTCSLGSSGLSLSLLSRLGILDV
jgi:hypothetical protein